MSLSVRLKRFGRKGSAFYRVVVAESRRKRDGVVIEELGYYDPYKEGDERVFLKKDRMDYWFNKGVKPTQTVKSLFKKTFSASKKK